MKTYDVSLIFEVNDVDSLEHIRNFFLNDKRIKFTERILDDEILARIDPRDCNEYSYFDQVSTIAEAVNSKKIEELEGKYTSICIDIAVYYSTYTCSINLPAEFIQSCLSIHPNISINYACYPVDES